MFNLFKRNSKSEVIVAEPKVITKGKTTNQIIEEIHESFFTEVDRLLAEAKISKSLETDKQGLIDKCKRLETLGFNQTKEIIEARKELARLKALEEENRIKSHVIKAIEYFSVKYPNYKFITEDSVKKICSKYNLIYGSISRYIGTVPDKNLKHMEDFNVNEEDVACIKTTSYGFGHADTKIVSYLEKTQFDNMYSYEQREGESNENYRNRISNLYMRQNLTRSEFINKCPLEIAAPSKDFNMDKSELVDFKLSDKIEIPDPVVLQPVYFDGYKHYLVVTAWGLEASDELVVNNKMN